MNMLGETEFSVRSYECGPDAFATLASVMNYLQEAAGLHAETAGFSKREFNAAGEDISWVLTRFHLKMTRYPRWHERVKIVTWPCGGRKIVADRDFEIFVDDAVIGMAASEWMILDLASRKIVPVPQKVYDLANNERSRALGADHRFSKLRWEAQLSAERAMSEATYPPAGGAAHVFRARFRARRGDIDINRHVNNVRYVEWLTEVLPADAGKIGDFEIAFKSETVAGDEVIAEAIQTEPGAYMAHVAASDGRDHVVARIMLAL